MTKQERINIVNQIINKIATTGRKFFNYNGGISKIHLKNGKLYMWNEYKQKDMCLLTKNGCKPKDFTHGGTLWGLTQDFIDFINTGEDSNHNNGYGGLYCPYWGYPEEDMKEIQELAKTLNYLQ